MKNRINVTCLKLSILGSLLLVVFPMNSQVGVGTTTPKTALDIDGALSYRIGSSPATITVVNGNNNSLSLGGTVYSFYRISGATSAFNINGIIPISGVDGQIVTLVNESNQSAGQEIMYITHNSALETATSNRILAPNGQDLMIRGKYATVTLRYNSFNSRWEVLNNFNKVETWYTSFSMLNFSVATITLANQGITPTSGVTMSLCDVTGLTAAQKNNIQIEYLETQTDQFKFRVRNGNGGSPKSLVYAIMLYK